MEQQTVAGTRPQAIYLLPLFYALHMVEEFAFGFVPWADRYFGEFDWTQNLIGNAIFLVLLLLACRAYDRNPAKHLWLGMAGAMWVLANFFLHASTTLLGGEYSPGVVTATLLYLPGGVYFLRRWWTQGVLNAQNLALSFAVGALVFMILPTFIRAVFWDARLAKLFHLVD